MNSPEKLLRLLVKNVSAGKTALKIFKELRSGHTVRYSFTATKLEEPDTRHQTQSSITLIGGDLERIRGNFKMFTSATTTRIINTH